MTKAVFIVRLQVSNLACLHVLLQQDLCSLQPHIRLLAFQHLLPPDPATGTCLPEALSYWSACRSAAKAGASGPE